ncbi:hypothetical protein CEXT_14431 [Caerostris extrusa]|uniref:Uncharacterized protein n=1 Tax=Caerostris extrusa TaxID=172846 RepID=A0AAV4NJW0_CAEEX|nr:hypothetical protein CEXT_14431 [Caerostris extrusa]
MFQLAGIRRMTCYKEFLKKKTPILSISAVTGNHILKLNNDEWSSSSGEYPVSVAAYASQRFYAMSFFLITVDMPAQRSSSDSFSGNIGETSRSEGIAAHVASISSGLLAPGALARTE